MKARPSVPVTSQWALALFRDGFDTVSIALFMRVREATAYRLLVRAREAAR